MNKTLRFILLLCITSLTVGCRLAVIVVEGGEVQSASHGVCVAGAICIVDVDDPNFSETFTPVPEVGWYFQRWHRGDRFFCAGSGDLECSLSFEGHEDTEEVREMVASSEIFYLMPIFRQRSKIGELTDKEWLQPIDFQGYTRDQIAAVCSPESGLCSGALPGSSFDLTGYYWASSDDIYELYSAYGAEPPFNFSKVSPSTICYDFRESIYETSDSTTVISGFLRDPPNERGEPYAGGVICGALGEKEVDTIFPDPGPSNLSEYSESLLGAWFWLPVE